MKENRKLIALEVDIDFFTLFKTAITQRHQSCHNVTVLALGLFLGLPEESVKKELRFTSRENTSTLPNDNNLLPSNKNLLPRVRKL